MLPNILQGELGFEQTGSTQTNTRASYKTFCLKSYRVKELAQFVTILNGHHSSKRVVLVVDFHDGLWGLLDLLDFASVNLSRGRGPENQT